VVTLSTGRGIWGGGYMPPSQKKMNFSLGMACFGALCAVLFVRFLTTKMLNSPPEEVIWRTM